MSNRGWASTLGGSEIWGGGENTPTTKCFPQGKKGSARCFDIQTWRYL